MKKIDILNNLNFGNSIAEYDKNIVNYYINTYSTMDLVNDRYDIIKGTKGSGKTAMLVTLYDNQSKYSQLDGKRLIKAIELKVIQISKERSTQLQSMTMISKKSLMLGKYIS